MTLKSSLWKTTEQKHKDHSAPDWIAQMKENGKRRAGVFALLAFMMVLCYPLMTALTLKRYTGESIGSLIVRQGVGHDILGITGGSVIFLMTIGGVLCAVDGFSWIYSRKKIDMYLSQPITMRSRYLMTYINGILICFIPYIISLLLALLVISGAGAASGALFVNILFTLPAALIYFLAVYNLTLTAMMISGRKGMAVFFVLVGFLYDPLLRVTLESYCSSYFATFAARIESRQYISPIWRMVVMLDENMFFRGTGPITADEVARNLILPMLPGMGILLLEAVLFGTAAYLCYKKRPMEAVSQAAAFPAVRGPVKIALILPAGLLSSLGFCDAAGSNGFFVAVSGLLFGILFCQALLEILYAGDLKAFCAHKKSFATGAVITVCVYLYFALDIGGYDVWIPDQKQVESAAIEIYFDNHYLFEQVDRDGSPVWGENYALDTMEMTDVSAVLSLAGDGMGKDARSQSPDTQLSCEVKYRLKNGKEKYRSFTIDYEQEKTVLDILFANEEYKEGASQLFSGQMDRIFEKSRVYYNDGLQEREASRKNALQLMRAYQEDVREMSFSEIKDAVPCGILKLEYQTEREGEMKLEYPVFPGFKRTVEYLREKNIPLYPNIDPKTAESIKMVYYAGEEDAETSFFAAAGKAEYAGTVLEKEYGDREQIEELLGFIYPSYLADWMYVSDSIDRNMKIQIQEAEDSDVWYNEWNETFVMKKDRMPEFIKKDIEEKREKNGDQGACDTGKGTL